MQYYINDTSNQNPTSSHRVASQNTLVGLNRMVYWMDKSSNQRRSLLTQVPVFRDCAAWLQTVLVPRILGVRI
jgi:hypothetical protein